jgi:hypothetical protein
MTRAFVKNDAVRAVKTLRDNAHAILAEAGWVDGAWEAEGEGATGYCLAGGINMAATARPYSVNWSGLDRDGGRPGLPEPETYYAVQALKRAVSRVVAGPDLVPAKDDEIRTTRHVVTTTPAPYPHVATLTYGTVIDCHQPGTDYYDRFIVQWNDNECGSTQYALDLLLGLTDQDIDEAVEAEYPLCEPVRGLAAPAPESLALAAGSK